MHFPKNNGGQFFSPKKRPNRGVVFLRPQFFLIFYTFPYWQFMKFFDTRRSIQSILLKHHSASSVFNTLFFIPESVCPWSPELITSGWAVSPMWTWWFWQLSEPKPTRSRALKGAHELHLRRGEQLSPKSSRSLNTGFQRKLPQFAETLMRSSSASPEKEESNFREWKHQLKNHLFKVADKPCQHERWKSGHVIEGEI